MHFVFKNFEALAVTELYQIYELRSKVFVVEQDCAYQDPDDKDLLAFHLLMFEGTVFTGYCRILPPGLSYSEPAIGRVVVEKKFRGAGSGQKLMKHSIHKTMELFKNQDIVISAQSYLISFYTQLGFISEGSEYLEDNIPHVKMRYKKTDNCSV